MERLAGGRGAVAAMQHDEALLRRAVLANLLWENVAYENGVDNAEYLRGLIQRVHPMEVARIAIEARTQQKLRHVPLLLAREMARLDSHKYVVGDLLPQIILRADEISEFLAIYWKDGKQPISKQVKKGLSAAFHKFNAYQFKKNDKKGNAVKIRDAMFLTHPKPANNEEELFSQIANDTLPTPDTWEVALSAGIDKKATWERLISENKLGALAFVRNLRNMVDANVDPQIIQIGFDRINPEWLLPINYITAARIVPQFIPQLERLMLAGLAQAPKLAGSTVFIVDVSGSMLATISARSEASRLDVAAAMTVLAREMCEDISIYVTAGNDLTRVHETMRVPAHRGFALSKVIVDAQRSMGRGGIFTRQCLEWVRNSWVLDSPRRIIVFSDSQDCDTSRSLPKPFGTYNYIVDVSSHRNGINYNGVWTAEVSGWSEHFLTYIAAYEQQETK